jgi:hypothetical protein
MQQNWLDAQQKGQEKVMKNKGGKIYLCQLMFTNHSVGCKCVLLPRPRLLISTSFCNLVEPLGPYAHHLTVQIFTGPKGCLEGPLGAEVTAKPHKAFAACT